MVNRSSGTSQKWLFRFLTAALLVACFTASLAREAAAADNVDSEAPSGKNNPSQGSNKEENLSSEDDIEVEEDTTEELGSLARGSAIAQATYQRHQEESAEAYLPPSCNTSSSGNYAEKVFTTRGNCRSNWGATAGATGGATAGATGGATAGATGGATAGATGGATAGATGGATAGATGGATAGANERGKTASGVGGPMGPLLEKLAAKLDMGVFYSEEDEEDEPEEDEEEALAETIIHGSKRKVIPRVRTAVDDLIDELEKEKIRKVAKTERHFQVLLERKKESEKRREADSVKPPQYFLALAQKAAQYHRTLYQEQQRRDAGKVLTPGQQRARKRAHRRHQKDKLLAWRRSQFAQVASTPAERQQHLASTRQESRDIEKTIDEDLDELDWGEFLNPIHQAQSSSELEKQTTERQ
ncbi:UNVERIFIED_CONTAM: hypothetical protein HHA_297920 [Hammondia hammondi]|eukprot:XP_008886067.1 hypothetical protein HHA_297920 [Hammondia hammondi]